MNFREYPWTFMDFHDQFQLGINEGSLILSAVIADAQRKLCYSLECGWTEL